MFPNLRLLTQVALGLLMFSPAVLSQAVSGRVGVEYSAEPEPHFTITNNYSFPITGVMAVLDELQRGHVKVIIVFDASKNDRDYEAIPTNRSRALKVPRVQGVDPATMHPEVKAIIFGDGSSIGEPSWVEALRMRRQCAFDELVAVEHRLTDAKKYFVDNDTIVASLKERQSLIKTTFVGNAGSGTAECRAAAYHVNELAVDNLLRASVDGEVGNPQKTIPAILPLLERWRARLATAGVGPQTNAPRP